MNKYSFLFIRHVRIPFDHYVSFRQGEYVAPERIENIYIQSKYVAQVFVYGNAYKVRAYVR
jgi:long-subunit acyl-CoA synthetase (AMP-forming)